MEGAAEFCRHDDPSGWILKGKNCSISEQLSDIGFQFLDFGFGTGNDGSATIGSMIISTIDL
jgi:hypothetical protein